MARESTGSWLLRGMRLTRSKGGLTVAAAGRCVVCAAVGWSLAEGASSSSLSAARVLPTKVECREAKATELSMMGTFAV
eukprot:4624536-Pleurochrysis_carterae.AAC.1